jgi:methylglutaconyl-CoA hydratase
MGLVHETVPMEELEPAVERVLGLLTKGGPVAQREAKRLALGMGGMTEQAMEQIDAENAALIARLRVSPEGQDGLSAFLDKGLPTWLR